MRWDYSIKYVDEWKVQIQKGKRVDVGEYLNQMGNDGWELAGIASGMHAYSHTLYFKRPKP